MPSRVLFEPTSLSMRTTRQVHQMAVLSQEQQQRTLPPALWRSIDVQRAESSGANPLCADRQATILIDALLPGAEQDRAKQDPGIDAQVEIAATHGAFLDRMVLDSVSRRVKQVVLIGSGMDTRVYRLVLPPQVKVVEVDELQVHQAKTQTLDAAGERARCVVHRLSAPETFCSNATLPHDLENVVDKRKPAIFVIEGMFCAWPALVQANALSALWALAGNGSSLVVQMTQHAHSQVVASTQKGVESVVDEVRAAMETAGWERVDLVGQQALSRMFHGRAPLDSQAALMVAERGVPRTPGRPSAPGTHRTDGATQSTYGLR